MIVIFLWSSVHLCVSAHEGHDHWSDSPICIKKSTYMYLQTIVSAYKELYSHLVKNELGEMSKVSRKIITASSQGLNIEKKGEGSYLMEHICLAATDLERAGSVKEAQMAFAA